MAHIDELEHRDSAERAWAESQSDDPAERAEYTAQAMFHAQMATYYATREVAEKIDDLQATLAQSRP